MCYFISAKIEVLIKVITSAIEPEPHHFNGSGAAAPTPPRLRISEHKVL
jgi:hypothetical protein